MRSRLVVVAILAIAIALGVALVSNLWLMAAAALLFGDRAVLRELPVTLVTIEPDRSTIQHERRWGAITPGLVVTSRRFVPSPWMR